MVAQRGVNHTGVLPVEAWEHLRRAIRASRFRTRGTPDVCSMASLTSLVNRILSEHEAHHARKDAHQFHRTMCDSQSRDPREHEKCCDVPYCLVGERAPCCLCKPGYTTAEKKNTHHSQHARPVVSLVSSFRNRKPRINTKATTSHVRSTQLPCFKANLIFLGSCLVSLC